MISFSLYFYISIIISQTVPLKHYYIKVTGVGDRGSGGSKNLIRLFLKISLRCTRCKNRIKTIFPSLLPEWWFFENHDLPVKFKYTTWKTFQSRYWKVTKGIFIWTAYMLGIDISFVGSLYGILQIWCSDFENFPFGPLYGPKSNMAAIFPAMKWPKSKIATSNL